MLKGYLTNEPEIRNFKINSDDSSWDLFVCLCTFFPNIKSLLKLQSPSQKKKRWKEKQAVLFCTFAKNILFTDLGIPFSEFLEHVGVGLLVLFVMFLNLALAYGNLSTSCPIGGVDLQHLLKVCHGQAEFITKEPRFPSAVQSLLVVLVELHHLTRQHQTQGGGVTLWCTAKRKRSETASGSRKLTLLQFSTTCVSSFIRR